MAHISCSWWEALQWMEHLWVNSWPLHSVCGLGLWAHFANQWYRYRPILWWNPEPHIFWNQSWSSWWKWCCKNGIKEEFQWNFPNKNHISTQLSWNTYPFSSLMSALVLRQIFFNCLIFCRARTQYPCSFSSNSDKFVLVLHIGNKSRGNFDFNSRICNKSIGQWRTFNCSLLNSYTIRLNWIAPYDSACFSTSFSSKTKHTRNASISLLCKWMLPRKYQRSLNVQWFSWLKCKKNQIENEKLLQLFINSVSYRHFSNIIRLMPGIAGKWAPGERSFHSISTARRCSSLFCLEYSHWNYLIMHGDND